MGNTDVGLNLKVNAREVETLGTKMRRAFDSSIGRAFNSSMRDLRRSISENTRETERLVRQLREVERGSQAYDKLIAKLRGVRRETRDLNSDLRDLGGGGEIGGRAARGAAFQTLASGGRAAPAIATQMLTRTGMGLMMSGTLAATGVGLGIAGALGGASLLYGGFSSAMSAANQYRELEQAQMQAAPFLGTNRFRDVRGAGARFGLGAAQAVGVGGQLARGMYSPAGGADVGEALALQQLYGVDVGLTGQFRGAAMRAGVGLGVGPTSAYARAAVGTGGMLGLEGAAMVEYLQEQTQILKSMERAGQIIHIPSLLASQVQTQRQLGIEGYRASAVTSGFGQGVRRIGMQGMQSGLDVRVMRALGYTGNETVEEYSDLMLRAQDVGSSSKYLIPFLQSFIGEEAAGSPAFGARLIQRALGALGTEVGANEARTMMSNLFEADPEKRQKVFDSIIRASEADPTARGEGMARTVGRMSVSLAEVDNRLVDVGARIADTAVALQSVSVHFAKTFTNVLAPAMNDTARLLERASARLESMLRMRP